ncbi:MAG: glycoside hydrolase family 88 protein [Treponema sp.]|nr:glycoside hydrolase family 88 protein [Treponema sp.]
MKAIGFFEGMPEMDGSQAAAGLDLATGRILRALPRFTYRSQNHSGVGNVYPDCDNDQWTCGFWPGQIWLAYLHSRDPVLKYAGLIQSESMSRRIKLKIDVDHHDMGFLYTPSCTAAWQIVGDERSREAALLAADQMLTRFQEKGRFFQAWGTMGAANNYRFIVDCLMNLPLLYWASAQTGNAQYAEKADAHAETCLAHSFRDDGSTHHTFFMNPATGAPVRGETCQGYKDDSAWARGQAWAIYGAALLYRHAKKPEWKNTFNRACEYFLSKLPDDLVPYWDLIFTSGDEPRDSSSSAIAACGLLEMASQTEGAESTALEKTARRLLAALAANCAATGDTDGLLLHGTYGKKSPFNTCAEEGVDECLTWGDYFYMEALTRLACPEWKPFWHE